LEFYIIKPLSIILQMQAKKHSWFWGYSVNLHRQGHISPFERRGPNLRQYGDDA